MRSFMSKLEGTDGSDGTDARRGFLFASERFVGLLAGLRVRAGDDAEERNEPLNQCVVALLWACWEAYHTEASREGAQTLRLYFARGEAKLPRAMDDNLAQLIKSKKGAKSLDGFLRGMSAELKKTSGFSRSTLNGLYERSVGLRSVSKIWEQATQHRAAARLRMMRDLRNKVVHGVLHRRKRSLISNQEADGYLALIGGLVARTDKALLAHLKNHIGPQKGASSGSS